MHAHEVLDFWFGPEPLATRREWFVKSAGFDEDIRRRFGALVDSALQGPAGWNDAALSALAELIVLDQFTRNLFRGQSRAFAGDARACALALKLVDSGDHLALHPLQRWFAYMPLEHAEDLGLQDRCVALFEALVQQGGEHANALKGALDYAHKHREVIRQFGRFPHRNAALGRSSTAAEAAYLATPGSGF
jgi:uncharacterized protein (DUF924 family)